MQEIYTWFDLVFYCGCIAAFVSVILIFAEPGLSLFHVIPTIAIFAVAGMVPDDETTQVTGTPLATMLEVTRPHPAVRRMVVEASKDGKISVAEYRMIGNALEDEASKRAQAEVRGLSGR